MYCAALFISSVEQWNCHEWLRMNGLGTVPRQVGCGDKERGAQRILEHERETAVRRERGMWAGRDPERELEGTDPMGTAERVLNLLLRLPLVACVFGLHRVQLLFIQQPVQTSSCDREASMCAVRGTGTFRPHPSDLQLITSTDTVSRL